MLALSFSVYAEQQPTRVYIVHGYGASPQDHWFPWLKQQLEKDGAQVSIVELPSSSAPTPEGWQQALEAQVARPDEHTFFVTHSLGSIALLRYLNSRKDLSTAGGVVLVSGFNERLPNIPELDSFYIPQMDYARLSQVIHKRTVIAAKDDVVVPAVVSERLAAKLDARFVLLPKGGHFLAAEGYTELPVVVDQLQRLMHGD